MGEQYMYDEMEREMDLAILDDNTEEAEAQLRAEMAAMQAFAMKPKDEFVSPFMIKDVVHSNDHQMVGKVIGLPTQEDVKAEAACVGKAWIYFTNGSRKWVTAARLSMVRRSPIKRPRLVTPEPRASIQTKLFATSRGESASAPAAASIGTPAPLAQHERDRAPFNMPPAGVRGRQKAGFNGRETKVSVTMRIQQYPEQGFRDSAGQLFCGPCKTTIANVKSSIDAHAETCKHKNNLAKFNARTSSDIDLMADLAAYFVANPDEVGGKNVSQNVQLYRYRVTESFLHAGIDISKADNLRYLLERTGQPLTHSSNLKCYIPKVEAIEVAQVKKDFEGQLITWIFDGTTRIGELVCIVGRWCSFDFYIKQRLATLKTFERHLNASQLARVLAETVLTTYQVPIINSIQWQRDSASVNGAAVEQVAPTFSAAEDGKCFPSASRIHFRTSVKRWRWSHATRSSLCGSRSSWLSSLSA